MGGKSQGRGRRRNEDAERQIEKEREDIGKRNETEMQSLSQGFSLVSQSSRGYDPLALLLILLSYYNTRRHTNRNICIIMLGFFSYSVKAGISSPPKFI